MGLKAGALLWNRMRIDLGPGLNNIDTGLTQLNRSFDDMSPGEPPLGVSSAAPPLDGTLPASRIQVMPLAPFANWTTVSMGEPYYDTDTNTIHVTLGVDESITINALFWDPHSMVGPGQADTYNPFLVED